MYDVSLVGNYRRDVDGGYLIEGVTILAEGIWNGTKFTSIELAKSATKWRDNTIWNRHYNEKSRDKTNRIGYLENQHYSWDRIVADVFLSNETKEGRDMIDLVKDNTINGISVEYVDITVDSVATEISFLGAAIVPDPACSICQLSKQEAIKLEDKVFKELQDTVAELAKNVKDGDTGKLQDTVDDLAKSITELQKIDVDAVVKEQSKKDTKVIEGLEKRIKELEDEPITNMSKDSEIEDTYAGIEFSVKEGIHKRM